MTGACLCGQIRYQVSGTLKPSVACHCSQCRRTSGHYWSATQVGAGQLAIEDPSGALRWFRSSPEAERGFCSICGSSLFWRHKDDAGAVSVGSGTLDTPTGMTQSHHIHTADKGDYYTIRDGLPQS